ncbi:MAG: dhbF [Devosia sp.]|jgi:acyl carrier protein|nr:dhbF [Devosia sp.]
MDRLRSRDDYLANVAQAWRETLPDVAFDADRRWEDVGADSFASLQLLMQLEDSLGISIPLDLLRPESTPAMLAAALWRINRA